MCIRDSFEELSPSLKKNDNLLFIKANSLLAVGDARAASAIFEGIIANGRSCLLYTSDAADERSSVDLGGRRIIKKKEREKRSAREGGTS